jgi:hypothetical protein
MAGALDKEYQAYLDRFTNEIGDTDLGAFAKYNGKLIKKMVYEEFASMYREYLDALKFYEESIERGDTINDIVVKLVRDRATDLVLMDSLV